MKKELKKNTKNAQKKFKNLTSEFKNFIARGNVIDLAVGVIIGSAFSKIISSIVDDILMPLLGIVIGGINFKDLSFKVGDATIGYGLFLQNIIDFLIVAFCIFIFVKLINSFNKKVEETPKAPKPTKEEILLTEIRDLLKKKK